MYVLSFSFGDLLSFTLTAFVELMDHGIVSWDTFSVAFIKKVSQESDSFKGAGIKDGLIVIMPLCYCLLAYKI